MDRRETYGTLGSWLHGEEGIGRVSKRLRFAVVGLGSLSQSAILPAFAHARGSAELVALVSGDPDKLQLFGRKYRVKHLYDYHGYEDCLASGDIDAVYVALPNNQHRELTVRAARAGVHVLCEKPMAVDVEECVAIRNACHASRVQFMVAYRTEFEEANLRARELARSGRLGDLRHFYAFSAVPRSTGLGRWAPEISGGPLLDLGIDCVHAARRLFRAEPFDVTAVATRSRRDHRLGETDDTVSVAMRFPDDRLATFSCSHRASEASHVEVHGTEGSLRLENPFSHLRPIWLRATVKGRTREKTFRKRDQFALGMTYFADCVLSDRALVPSADEGEKDLRVIEAIRRSLANGRTETLELAPAFGDDGRTDLYRGLGARDTAQARAAGPSS